MLILQQLLNPSDSELDFQVNDRRSFEEFIGLGMMDTIPILHLSPFSVNV
jgi:IS5 family transposase